MDSVNDGCVTKTGGALVKVADTKHLLASLSHRVRASQLGLTQGVRRI